MRSLFLTLSRFCICAWVGAAALFVVTAVAEATSPEFSSEMKRSLALLRFPFYYAFGFALVSAALLAGLLSGRHWAAGGVRRWFYRALLALALGGMIFDYLAVYQPMEKMLAASETARPAEFERYHRASMYVNAGHVGLCLLAALVICWPGTKRLQ
jgi:hypothetical protein